MTDGNGFNSVILRNAAQWEWMNFLSLPVGKTLESGTSAQVLDLVKQGFVLGYIHMMLKERGGESA